MNIEAGFKIDSPDAFVGWGLKEAELVCLLGKSLKKITHGYYTISCKSLGGLEHKLGFHFSPRDEGSLRELELFQEPSAELERSYTDFQKHLEDNFGKPTHTKPGSPTYEPRTYESHEWRLGSVKIVHYVQYRFGTEQVLRISNAA